MEIAREGGSPLLQFVQAPFPDQGTKADEVLRAADAALYRAKAPGRNRVISARPSGLVKRRTRMTLPRLRSREPHNKLLALLGVSAYDRLIPHLTATALTAKQLLYRPEQAIDTIYFPKDAVICQLAVMKNGATVETATVGHEGASWISASIGANSMPCATIVAIGGDALKLPIDTLARELKVNEPFRHVLTQYSHALLINSMRLVGCNTLHSAPRRCARWILTTLDRVPADRFSITHEFLAMLLGISRPTASIVIEDLARAGAVSVRRGQVTLGDRRRLLDCSCECYHVIKKHYAQVGRE